MLKIRVIIDDTIVCVVILKVASTRFWVDTKAAAQKVVANDCPARHARCQQSKANTAVWMSRETPFRIVATAVFLPEECPLWIRTYLFGSEAGND